MAGFLSKITSILNDPSTIERAVALGFDRFDKDRSGFIEKSEILGVLETVFNAVGLGTMPPAAAIDAVFSKCAGADGRIDRTEFTQLVRELFERLGSGGGDGAAQ